MRITMTKVGNDVVRDDGATIKVVRRRRSARHEANRPKGIADKLVPSDHNIARAVHRLHAHERVRDDVVGNDNVIAMQVYPLRGIFDMIAKDPGEIADHWRSHNDTGALLPIVHIIGVPGLLIHDAALLWVLFHKVPKLVLGLHLRRRHKVLLDDPIALNQGSGAVANTDPSPIGAIEGVAVAFALGAVIDREPHVVLHKAVTDAAVLTLA